MYVCKYGSGVASRFEGCGCPGQLKLLFSSVQLRLGTISMIPWYFYFHDSPFALEGLTAKKGSEATRKTEFSTLFPKAEMPVPDPRYQPFDPLIL